MSILPHGFLENSRDNAMQADFFRTIVQPQQASISGLTYMPDFISAADEVALLQIIDKQPWLNDLKRRVQHYGYRYDYKARAVTAESYLGPMPEWLSTYADRLQSGGHFKEKPDQAIINEYSPGQGISAHIDCVPCFTDTIASLSLGSACVMVFTNIDSAAKQSLLLETKSLVVMTGDARYRWTHAIAARKTDRLDGVTISRNRRVSLTFRKVIVS